MNCPTVSRIFWGQGKLQYNKMCATAKKHTSFQNYFFMLLVWTESSSCHHI